jgi:hypothetical protein
LSTPDQAETDSSPQGNDRLVLERAKLELETRKLELEIKHLSGRWWHTPSFWASMATICAALLGFGWAATTGFFDVSRRDLEVGKREVKIEIGDLKEHRDRQSREYAVEAAKQQKAIQRLQSEMVSAQLHVNSLTTELADKKTRLSELDATTHRLQSEVISAQSHVNSLTTELEVERTRLLQLNQPIVTSWETTGGVGDASIGLTGLNFGTARGQISCTLNCYTEIVTGDPDKDNELRKYVTGEFCTVAAWSANKARARFNVPYFRKTPFSGMDSLNLTLTRSDGKTVSQKVTLPKEWSK